jgi:protoporphyrinogen oxidase
MMSNNRLVIVGGGITGVWAALHARAQGLPVTIISADPLGGLISSVETKSRDSSVFLSDLGGHVYTLQDKRVAELMEEAGAQYHDRNAVYLGKGGTVPYPVQDHPDLLGIPIVPQDQQPASNDLYSWAVSKFGPQFVESWYRPFNQRVWTADLEEMSCDWVASRVKVVDQPSQNWGPNSRFAYAPGRDIVAVLSTRMMEAGLGGPDFLAIHGEVDHVDAKKRVIRVKSGLNHSGILVEYNSLVWTAKPHDLVASVGLDPSGLVSNTVAVFAVYTEPLGSERHDWHWAYADVSASVHRITNLSLYHPAVSSKGNVYIFEVPFRKGYRNAPSWAATPDLISRHLTYSKYYTTETDFNACLQDAGLPELMFTVKDAHVLKFSGYPIPLVGVRSIMTEAKGRLAELGIFLAGRWGDWGYYNIDHCFSSAEAAVNSTSGTLSPHYLRSSFYYA